MLKGLMCCGVNRETLFMLNSDCPVSYIRKLFLHLYPTAFTLVSFVDQCPLLLRICSRYFKDPILSLSLNHQSSSQATLYRQVVVTVQGSHLKKKQKKRHFSPLFAGTCKTDVWAVFDVHLVLAVSIVCRAQEVILIIFFS